MTLKDLWNKLDIIAVIGFLIAVETQITNGSMSLAHTIPEAWIPIVKEWAANLASLGGLMVGIFRMAGAPSTAPSSPIPPALVKILLVAFAGSLIFLSGIPSAQAQTTHRQPQQSGPVLTGDLIQDAKNGFKGDPNDPSAGIKLTGNLKKDAEALWTKIQAAALVDLQYASAMAGAAGTNGSAVRKACWDAIIVVNQQSNGAGLKDANGQPLTKPDPHLFTDVETAAEILDNLSPQGKLFTSCAGAAQLAQANVIQFISAAIAGAAGIAKLTPIPGL